MKFKIWPKKTYWLSTTFSISNRLRRKFFWRIVKKTWSEKLASRGRCDLKQRLIVVSRNTVRSSWFGSKWRYRWWRNGRCLIGCIFFHSNMRIGDNAKDGTWNANELKPVDTFSIGNPSNDNDQSKFRMANVVVSQRWRVANDPENWQINDEGNEAWQNY